MNVRGLKLGIRGFLVPPPLLPGVGEEFKFPKLWPYRHSLSTPRAGVFVRRQYCWLNYDFSAIWPELNFRLFRSFHLKMYQFFFYCLWVKVEDINCFFTEPCQNPSSRCSGDSQYQGKKEKQVKCPGFENLALPQAQKFLVLDKIFHRRLTLLVE